MQKFFFLRKMVGFLNMFGNVGGAMRCVSEEVFQKAARVIPGGVNSPVRSFQGLSMSPMVVESGLGDLIWDVDGNKYIDYCGSWGALILGHADPDVVRAASDQMAKGSTFGISTAGEEEIASKIVSLIPSIEKLRFVSSGTEAVMTALRLARGFTGRSKIVKFSGHYHGHLDSLLTQAGSGVNYLNPQASSKGVTEGALMDTISLPFNDFKSVRALFQSFGREIAAVILEPIAANMGVVLPEKGFLEMLREETKKAGALLIFDEIITGFRVGLKGAQGKYSIDPDLTCFGKIVGGGFPAALVGGKGKILDCLAPLGQVYQAGTLSGNPVAMRAGLETLIKVERDGFFEELFEKTNRLTRPIQEALKHKNGCLQQAGSMFTLFLGVKQVRSKEERAGVSEPLFAKFFRYLFERGIYIPPSSHEAWFVSMAHTNEHLEYTAKCVTTFLQEEC